MRGKNGRWHSKELAAPEFSRRLKRALSQSDVRVVWFVGAGCSISSGIPAAAELVRLWLPQLNEVRSGSRDGWEAMAERDYPDWPANPARYYGTVIEDLFESEGDRQREIEQLTGGKDPGFGYAALAQLMSHPDVGSKANVAITVNFDDLIADSLYLYTAKKPLVIGHEALTRFIRRGDRTPLVVKVHGDAHLAPKNTSDETSTLTDELVRAVQRLCARARIVVMGYAGADESIARMFRWTGDEAGPEVVYWVNDAPPGAALMTSLAAIPARVRWVRHLDFDSLMLELRSCFGLGLPDFERLRSLQGAYESTLRRLAPEDEDVDQEEAARGPKVTEILEELRGSRIAAQARAIEESDPEKADELYMQALEIDPQNASILGRYAVFLDDTKKERDRAESMFERALAADPTNVANIANYARMLSRFARRADQAQDMYERALELDSTRANVLTNYATFLWETRRDFDRAEELYQRALDSEPNHPSALGNYAVFVRQVRRDHNRAEEFYRRALDADPQHPLNLANFAFFLSEIRRDRDAADEMYRRAVAAAPRNGALLSTYADFKAKTDPDRAEEMYEEALTLSPDSPDVLGSFALFLKRRRKDFARAGELYRRAIAADATNSRNLGNYAVFLLGSGAEDGAIEDAFRQTLALDPESANDLGNYAGFLYSRGELEEARSASDKALKNLNPATDKPLELEIWFYRYCFDAQVQDDALARMQALIVDGVRSIGFDLSPHVRRAKELGHPRLEVVEAAARVIGEDEGLEHFLALTDDAHGSGSSPVTPTS